MNANRIFLLAGGLCGAAGVAFSAVAAHSAGANTGTAASFMLAHAPAFVAIGLAGRRRALFAGAAVLILGTVLFCGDLLMRDLAGHRLLPMAAPAGGTLMILGWIGIAASAFFREPPENRS